MTPETFRSSTDDMSAVRKSQDFFTDEELADLLGLNIGSCYLVGQTIITIDDIDVNGAERAHNGKWLCRTPNVKALADRCIGVMTFYPAQPVGDDIIHVDTDEADEKKFDIDAWVDFRAENNFYKLTQKDDNVFSIGMSQRDHRRD